VIGQTDIDLFGEEFGRQTLGVDRRVMETVSQSSDRSKAGSWKTAI